MWQGHRDLSQTIHRVCPNAFRPHNPHLPGAKIEMIVEALAQNRDSSAFGLCRVVRFVNRATKLLRNNRLDEHVKINWSNFAKRTTKCLSTIPYTRVVEGPKTAWSESGNSVNRSATGLKDACDRVALDNGLVGDQKAASFIRNAKVYARWRPSVAPSQLSHPLVRSIEVASYGALQRHASLMNRHLFVVERCRFAESFQRASPRSSEQTLSSAFGH